MDHSSIRVGICALVIGLSAAGEVSAQRYQQSCTDYHCAPCQPAMPGPAQPAPANPAPNVPEPEQAYAAPAAPPMYVAPAPTGARVGTTSAFELPEIQVTLPEIRIATPTIRIQGFRNVVRDSFMQLDAGTAPQFNGVPAAYAPLATGGAGQAHVASPAAPQMPRQEQGSPAAPAADPFNGQPAENPPCWMDYKDYCTQNDRQQLEKTRQELQELQQQIKSLKTALAPVHAPAHFEQAGDGNIRQLSASGTASVETNGASIQSSREAELLEQLKAEIVAELRAQQLQQQREEQPQKSRWSVMRLFGK